MPPLTKKPPAPPKLASKEEVAARLGATAANQATDDEEQGEGTTVDQIRSHLAEIDSLLDELEQSGQG